MRTSAPRGKNKTALEKSRTALRTAEKFSLLAGNPEVGFCNMRIPPESQNPRIPFHRSYQQILPA